MPLLILAAALLAAAPDDAADLARQSQQALRAQEFERALQLAEKAVAADSKSAAALVARGCARFQLARIAESVADFERAVELQPRLKPELWQLGIAYYYAGRYTDGAKLFTLHKSVNPDDVENAAWHFLCTARAEGVEKAKANVMPIRVEEDRRVPMAQIYALFQGQAKPDEVFANLVRPNERITRGEQTRREFYAHLYVGLYFESLGETTKAKEHLEQAAAAAAKVGDYMAGVARVHVELLRKPAPKN